MLLMQIITVQHISRIASVVALGIKGMQAAFLTRELLSTEPRTEPCGNAECTSPSDLYPISCIYNTNISGEALRVHPLQLTVAQ